MNDEGAGAAGASDAAAHASDPQDPAAAEAATRPDKAPAVIGYLSCALIPLGFFLGPLATWLVWRMRRDDPFVDFHGRQALDLTGAGLLAAIGVWLLLRGAHAILVPRGLGGLVVDLGVLQIVVVALYVGLLVWGVMVAARGQMQVLPLGLPWLRARAKNRETVEAPHGE